MRLSELMVAARTDAPAFGIDPFVTAVTDDSRQVTPGALFVARPGSSTDGVRFAIDAQNRGAVAVVSQSPIEGLSVPTILVPDAARAASVLAHALAGQPSTKLKLLGVTGTNGKTTTAYLLRQLVARAGVRCGMVGTVEFDDGVCSREAEMTTPGAVEIASLLARMVENGCGGCAMEVSSHALDQRRVAGLTFAAAGFTNLTGDHLDYHKTMDNYAAAKARLFEMLDEQAVAVVNAGSDWHRRMIERCPAPVVKFSVGGEADYAARDIAITASGSRFVLHTPDGSAPVRMSLIGRHNIENALCAAAMVGEVLGVSVHQLSAWLAQANGAPGRLTPVDVGQPFSVLVDYAHTDDALENVLRALRPLTRKRLMVVFGCGGDRDKTKRPRMAKVAERLADVVCVTSDNPRTEDPLAIIDQILAGLSPDARRAAIVEPDRRLAIAKALEQAEAGDVVLIAGKGHENYQILGTTKHPFDDAQIAAEQLRSLLTGRGV